MSEETSFSHLFATTSNSLADVSLLETHSLHDDFRAAGVSENSTSIIWVSQFEGETLFDASIHLDDWEEASHYQDNSLVIRPVRLSQYEEEDSISVYSCDDTQAGTFATNDPASDKSTDFYGEPTVYDILPPPMMTLHRSSRNSTPAFEDFVGGLEYHPADSYFLYPLHIFPEEVVENFPTKDTKGLKRISALAGKFVGKKARTSKSIFKHDIRVIPNKKKW
ncbi:hypothetical protein C8J56DRAFT_899426 [Mycena floridula]|nr:hypothetical protein C8J56DRAFT_899426 [Mycena floridula]